MQSFTLTEAKAKFSEVVEKAMVGEEIIVTKMGKPAVRVMPYSAVKEKIPLLGCMQGQGKIHGDFNDPWPEDIARALHIID